jgi:AcrR family transcriptional regulator
MDPTATGPAAIEVTQRPAEDGQRWRIVAAMAELAAAQGQESVTVTRVVELAEVSRETFYEHFEDRSDCLSAVLDSFVSLLAERAQAAGRSGGTWLEQMRAGLLELLRFLDANPHLARVCVSEAITGSLHRPGRRAELLEQLPPVLDEGRALAPADRQAPEGAAKSVIGGTIGMIHARLISSDERSLVDLLNPLMGMVVLPYLGEAAALRELTRSPEADLPEFLSARAWPACEGGAGSLRSRP